MIAYNFISSDFFLQIKVKCDSVNSAGIAVFANYEVPDLDLIEPENNNPSDKK
jgi:hypothetical protein